MAKNEVYRLGQYVPLPVPEGTKAGDPVRVGGLNAVAVSERNSYEGEFGGHVGEASTDLGGAHTFNVTVSGGPLKAGQPIYIKADNSLVTVATDNNLFGHSLEYNVPNGAHVVTVKIAN